MHRRTRFLAAAILLVTASCSGTAGSPSGVAPLPEVSPTQIEALLTESEDPVVINIWASWCIPCRSEAPLLRTAHRRFGEEIRFVGVAVRDRQADSRAFLDEFDLAGFEHLSDPPGDVPASLGGRGVPLTFFFHPGGDLSHLHSGVIDERTLALHLDELARSSG